jgi:hypothetical protein
LPNAFSKSMEVIVRHESPPKAPPLKEATESQVRQALQFKEFGMRLEFKQEEIERLYNERLEQLELENQKRHEEYKR